MVAIENYGRMARLLDRKVDVELEMNVQNKIFENVTNNDTIAEIPGTDPKLKDEVVMLGAHLDSWAGATGATDNGSGSAVVMEAMRILKALDVKPRRTIRVALWSGEEQGLLGSEGYVRNHFASFAPPTGTSERCPAFVWRPISQWRSCRPSSTRSSRRNALPIASIASGMTAFA